MSNNRLAIIGAGISGLVTAFCIQKNLFQTEIFEKNSEPGGAIRSVHNGDWMYECGPNTLLLKNKVVKDFIDGMGLIDEKITANPDAEKRYIIKNGELVALPGTFISAIKTPLFSSKAKIRILGEPFISKNGNRDQTVAGFVERRLGKEILDYAINPFVAGIFANNPENLSLRHAFPAMNNLEQEYGSLIWGSFAGSNKRKDAGGISRELISFRNGVQQLPETIAGRLENIHYDTEIIKIGKEGANWYVYSRDNRFGPYEKVVVNTPIYKWSEQFPPIQKEKLEKLRKVNYPPLSVLHLGYKKSDIKHPLDGFGFLVPEKENRKILGALFSSTLFEERAPKDHHLLTLFIGGGRQPELATLDSDKMLSMVEAELRDLIGLKGKPVFKNHIYWPKSIPAYHVGYDEILNTLQSIEDENPGLYLTGNYRHGISVPDCIMNGMKLADRIIND